LDRNRFIENLGGSRGAEARRNDNSLSYVVKSTCMYAYVYVRMSCRPTESSTGGGRDCERNGSGDEGAPRSEEELRAARKLWPAWIDNGRGIRSVYPREPSCQGWVWIPFQPGDGRTQTQISDGHPVFSRTVPSRGVTHTRILRENGGIAQCVKYRNHISMYLCIVRIIGLLSLRAETSTSMYLPRAKSASDAAARQACKKSTHVIDA
jgi:hypothetical protein